MRRASSITGAVGLAVLPFLATGCVQQDRYDSLMMTNRQQKVQIQDLETERNTARSNADTLRQELNNAKTENGALASSIDTLRGELGDQTDAYGSLLDDVRGLRIGPLPMDVENALEGLATNYAQLLTFDADRGMIRFSSDLTFDLGSVALKPEASDTIVTIADILNTAEAAYLEIQVVGHTDNVPIGKPDTRRNHPTNTHLSVHRSISVRDALIGAGIEPVRIQVAGYGEFRPIIENGRRGAVENRRVELFLRPTMDWTLLPAQDTLATPGISAENEDTLPVPDK